MTKIYQTWVSSTSQINWNIRTYCFSEETCAALQHCITKQLCERLQRAIEFIHRENSIYETVNKEIINVKTLVVSGGVASNGYIRQGLDKVAGHYNMATVYPPPSLCTDNGVMIAWNGLERTRADKGLVPWTDVLDVPVISRSPLGEDWHPRVEQAAIKCKWIKI